MVDCNYAVFTKQELLQKCGELGITRCKSKTKGQLVELLVNANANMNAPQSQSQPSIPPATAPLSVQHVHNVTLSSQHQLSRTVTFIEVCAGGGGLSTGLMQAGFTPVLLNDNNRDCCNTLQLNHPNTKVVCGTMENIDLSSYADSVDLLTGGVPCQSFSQAGLRKGLEDPRGDLMLKFVDMLYQVRPKMFMIENVKGLLTHNGGETFRTILKELNRGELYNISYQCLDASKYGVPQKRERVFVVGVMRTLGRAFVFPSECEHPKVLKEVLTDVPASAGVRYSKEKVELFKQIPQGGCWVNLPEPLQRAYLGNSFHSGGGKRGILYRLSMEKPSLTLLCTPTQKQTERCHPLEERPLTIREYARIQTFADEYTFSGSVMSQYKQIGNAVPVELARRMGDALMNVLSPHVHTEDGDWK